MKKFERRSNGSVRVQTINDEPSRTQVQFKDECDINNIVAKFKNTGEVTHLARQKGVFADVSTLPADYQTALGVVADAEAAFAAVPSELRTKLGNDPAKFIEFMRDPKNTAEAVKYGLMVPRASEPKNDDAKKQNAINANKKNATSKKDSNTAPEPKED